MKDLKSLNKQELIEYIEEIGEKKFRANQLYDWMHIRHARSLDEMNNIPKNLKEKLKEDTYTSLKQIDVQISKEDGTRKYLFQLEDGNMVETVMMIYKHGISICISSQVGCKMGCRFCASTIDGFLRNLTPAEMLDQIYAIAYDLKTTSTNITCNADKTSSTRISNVVVMGTGEPLDNYDNLLKFIHLLTDENGLNISQRNITVSTCGLVPRIYDLAKEELVITLALSLHASSQEKRQELMPIANTYDIHEVVKAMQDYFNATHRRITYEYTLVSNVNDTNEDALRLAELVSGTPCHVNLIPVNPIKERSYSASDTSRVKSFVKKLEKCGINGTIRREMGRDIDGACGQLRRRHMKEGSV